MSLKLAEISRREAELINDMNGVERRNGEMDRRETLLNAHAARRATERAELDKKAGDLHAQSLDLSREREVLETREEELMAKEADFSARMAALTRKEAEFDARAADLARREADLGDSCGRIESLEEQIRILREREATVLKDKRRRMAAKHVAKKLEADTESDSDDDAAPKAEPAPRPSVSVPIATPTTARVLELETRIDEMGRGFMSAMGEMRSEFEQHLGEIARRSSYTIPVTPIDPHASSRIDPAVSLAVIRRSEEFAPPASLESSLMGAGISRLELDFGVDSRAAAASAGIGAEYAAAEAAEAVHRNPSPAAGAAAAPREITETLNAHSFDIMGDPIDDPTAANIDFKVEQQKADPDMKESEELGRRLDVIDNANAMLQDHAKLPLLSLMATRSLIKPSFSTTDPRDKFIHLVTQLLGQNLVKELGLASVVLEDGDTINITETDMNYITKTMEGVGMYGGDRFQMYRIAAIAWVQAMQQLGIPIIRKGGH